ncbi:MAG: hypothetical protein HRT35_02660 [Algicola sp.]|nr:hypothetical protein [Algicola sp.]
MKKLKKKVKENWFGFILGAALTYFAGPAVGLPVLQKALSDTAVEEAPVVPGPEVAEPVKSLTDSSPAVIINSEPTKENDDEK